DRLGQKSSKLTIFNLISRNSIEQQIAAGLLVKQSLFEGVLSKANTINYVDFSTKGRSQFIHQLEELVSVQTAENRETQESAAGDSAAGQPEAGPAVSPQQKQAAEMEQVLNNGMQFLSGLFKMATGKDFNLNDQKIEIDPASGEVLLRFKIKQ
ncbi:MAG: hypothetical protein LBN21_06105, partial [Treponema sp.]|nr:hypothetical protein [Treponema sp.]